MAATHVAFLRGINLGGRRIRMAELRSRVEEAGLVQEVDSYAASGNVIFRHEGEETDTLERALEAHLEQVLGYEVATLVRSLSTLDRLAGTEALVEARDDGFKPHVIFVRGAPDRQVRAALDALETPDDRFLPVGGELAWLRRGGVSDSTVEPRHLEKALGGRDHTMRTLGTVERIVARYGG